jgi:hypothetical protein
MLPRFARKATSKVGSHFVFLESINEISTPSIEAKIRTLTAKS